MFYKILYFLAIILLCYSCNHKIFYSKNFSYDSEWNINNIAKFSVFIDDIQSNYSIFFIIRNNKSYNHNNLVLCVQYDNQKNNIVTYNLINNKTNKWLGNGIFIKEVQFLYKKYFKFNKKGHHIFLVSHRMKPNSLIGIENIGMKIIKNFD